jgi:hypothetical protein
MNKKLKAKIVEHYGTLLEFCFDQRERPSFVSAVLHGKKELSEEKVKTWSAALKCDIGKLIAKGR